VVECGVDEIVLGRRRSVVDLDGQNEMAGQAAQLIRGGPGPCAVPHVDVQPTVGPVGQEHDLEGGPEIGNLRPGQPLEMDQKAALGGAIAQIGESRRTLLTAPIPAEDVGGIDRAGPEELGDAQELILVVAKYIHGVHLGRNVDVTGARRPPPGRIELGDGQAVVLDHRPEIGVAVPLVARPTVVTAPEGYGAEARPRRRVQAVEERDAPRQRARAEDEVGRSECHRRHDAASAMSLRRHRLATLSGGGGGDTEDVDRWIDHDGDMRLRIFVEPQQGARYEDQLAVARCAEEEGFDAFFRSDHYLKMGTGVGLPGPTDAWATLAGLARETSSIRLGTLVTPATFRLPGPLAITVAQVDAMSGGRIELGLGAGWYEDEHRAYAIAFPPLPERFDRLEEQLAVVTGLWETPVGETFNFDGRFYQVAESPALPKPTQLPRPPIILGGGGPKRTPTLAARFADEFNAPFLTPDDAATQYRRVDDACERIGRDPASVRHTAALIVCCGEDDTVVARRAQAIGWSVDDLRRFGACGSPGQVAERILQWGAAGAVTAYLQILDMGDLDHVRLIGREVAPLVAKDQATASRP